MSAQAQAIIDKLGLQAHPEGGWYRETWRDVPPGGGRGSGTAIFYLLQAGETSARHRIDATEIWHFYAGAPLELRVDGVPVVLGPDVLAGQQPQVIVPPRAWQAARSLGQWTLVGCSVSPAFDFKGFELG